MNRDKVHAKGTAMVYVIHYLPELEEPEQTYTVFGWPDPVNRFLSELCFDFETWVAG